MMNHLICTFFYLFMQPTSTWIINKCSDILYALTLFLLRLTKCFEFIQHNMMVIGWPIKLSIKLSPPPRCSNKIHSPPFLHKVSVKRWVKRFRQSIATLTTTTLPGVLGQQFANERQYVLLNSHDEYPCIHPYIYLCVHTPLIHH